MFRKKTDNTSSRGRAISALLALGLSTSLALVGCQFSSPKTQQARALGGTSNQTGNRSGTEKPLKIVTTTALLADIVSQVALPNAEVTPIIPPWADPHSYEIKLHDVRALAYGDIVFSNHLLLEEQSVMRAVEANRKADAPHVKLAEESKKYGAKLIRLVEDAALDTIWLGMRVRDPEDKYREGNQEVRICATQVTGPGSASAFLTGTFGQPQVYIDSSDGINKRDCVPLPTNAHTHMSWAFTKPGYYRVGFKSFLASNPKAEAVKELGSTQIRFAVGVDPNRFPVGLSGETTGVEKENSPVSPRSGANPVAQILRSGHMDVSVNLATSQFELYGDRADKKPGDAVYAPEKSVIEVPNAALSTVPKEVQYRFLGKAGDEIYLLAQAVLGKHVHGEIDPHVWESVPNVIAMVQVVQDALTKIDPAHAGQYVQRAKKYIEKLHQLDHYVADTIGRIPPEKRNLVTAHDAYGYLGNTYGVHIAGFVTANASMEPSTQDLVRLSRTLRKLQVAAVFVEPTYAAQANTLASQARAAGITVCQIYGDSLRNEVKSYLDLMATNAYNLKTCLDPENAPPVRFAAQNRKGK